MGRLGELHFEGPEKKLEITSQKVNFLSLDPVFWEELVAACGARILSQISNDLCKAYLLSESSLFVWQDKVLMITCGQTALIKSSEMIIEKIGVQNIQSFYFERKNEYFPEYQKSYVLEDFKKLKSIFKTGNAYRFGNKDDHHLFLFEYGKCIEKSADEQTLEILIYGVCEQLSDLFLNNSETSQEKLEEIIMDLFPEFKLDQYWFQPCGYSMNALKGDSYATIHVTPEKEQSYISFEMNNVAPESVQGWVDKIYKNFQPRSCDLIYYNNIDQRQIIINSDEMHLRQKNYAKIGSDFGVSFYHWSNPKLETTAPQLLQI